MNVLRLEFSKRGPSKKFLTLPTEPEKNRLSSGPEEDLKTGLHLQVRAHVSRLGQIHQTLVDIDTGAQISCVSEQWATDQQFPSAKV